MTRVIFFLVILLALFAGRVTAQPGNQLPKNNSSVEQIFETGNQFMEQRKFTEALAQFRQALTLTPDDPAILFNAGLAAFSIKEYQAAAEYWQKLKAVDPEDGQTRTKLVQVYQALGDIPQRDAERKTLIEMRKQDSGSELAQRENYCREQFEVAGRRVLVLEYFELKGSRAVRYTFIVLKDTEDVEDYHISLGSYDQTNRFWAERNSKQAQKGERLFHLDKYYDRGHETFGFYTPEPTYDEIRRVVIKVLEGKIKPISSTTVQ
jgi:tetratricopeptide (TPR) repeat protein